MWIGVVENNTGVKKNHKNYSFKHKIILKYLFFYEMVLVRVVLKNKYKIIC